MLARPEFSRILTRFLATVGTGLILLAAVGALHTMYANSRKARHAEWAVSELRDQVRQAERCRELLAARLQSLERRIAGALEGLRADQRAILRAVGAPRDESAKAQARHPPGDGPDER